MHNASVSLAPDILRSDLTELFASAPLPEAECAQAWADAMKAYAEGIQPPSDAVEAAAAALGAALSGMSEANAAMRAVLPSALLTFATSVGAGMAAEGNVGQPPPVPWAYPFPNTISADQAATGVATAIDVWMKTGVAYLGGNPLSPQLWS